MGGGEIMKNLSLLFLISFFLTACAGATVYPERWSQTKEAYPNKQSMNPPPEMDKSFESAIFPVSYDDAYRAALVSVTQLQLNLVEENEDEGFLLAKKLLSGVRSTYYPGSAGNVTASRRWHFAVTIKETGRKKTKVTIMTKSQGECTKGPGAAANILSLGLSAAVTAGRGKMCEEYSSVHWANGFDHAQQEMNQFITFVRNNLLSNGLI